MKSKFSVMAPVVVLMLVLAVAFAMPALAKQHRGGGQYGPGAMMGGGCGMMAGNATDPEFQAKVKKFQDETAPLRRTLVADWTELEAVMNAQTPDAAKARLLREKIFDTHQKLRDAAEKAGLGNGMGGMCGGMGGCGGQGRMGGGCGMGQGCM